MEKPLNSLLVKPSGPDCNMACGYCFYRGKGDLFPERAAHRMEDRVLREMIRRAMEEGEEHISFGWQGGEPTLMGVEFFERAVEYQERYGRGKTVGNGMQTNGILIDREWAEFLSRYRFLVGLSIDGPRHVHDRYRLTAGGASTWEKVLYAAKVLLDRGAAVNALSVVNDYSAKYPDEIYGFLKETGLSHIQFIPCVETGPDMPSGPADFSVSPEEYGAFLCRLFELWISDFYNGSPTTSIRFFESMLFSYAGIAPPECEFMEECGVYLVVEHNGDVYPCDFFVEPGRRLGNVVTHGLKDMLNSPAQNEFGLMKRNLPATCLECLYLPHCRGGCIKDRVRGPSNGEMNHFCGAYKAFFTHADEKLKEITGRWRAKQEARSRISTLDLKNTGRNDPCPCGSGLKFKKCCGAGL